MVVMLFNGNSPVRGQNAARRGFVPGLKRRGKAGVVGAARIELATPAV
jgi:hypothetical protein